MRWVTRNGRSLELSQMTTEHVHNALRMVRQRLHRDKDFREDPTMADAHRGRISWVAQFETELTRRQGWRVLHGPRACKLNGRDGSLYCPSCDEESYSQLRDGTYLYGARQCANGHRSREVRVPAVTELVRRTVNPDRTS